MCWCLAVLSAAAAFFYLTGIKITTYFQYAINVNAEIRYKDSMNFPAVTICNQNRYKMTALQRLGLFDVHEVLLSSSFKQGTELLGPDKYNGDKYFYLKDTCSIPSDVRWYITFTLITREACAILCSKEYDNNCSSILYNQSTQHCTLSSDNGCDHNCTCDPSGPMEFYIRQRFHAWKEITCTFEHDNCPFKVEKQFDKHHDVWTITPASVSLPSQDLTIPAGDGHYLLFMNTARRPGYVANFASPFINTTSKCVSFYFRFLGGISTINIIVRDVELVEYKLSTLKWSEPPRNDDINNEFGGKYFLKRLPAGEYQVIIQAVRNTNSGIPSGAALDNLFIVKCAQPECIRSLTGVDYVGTVSHTASNKLCLKWTDPRILSKHKFIEVDLPDLSLMEAQNYCRNPSFSLQPHPFCYIESAIGPVQKEFCNISYCECLSHDFRCNSGMCIPDEIKCDGENHCGDNSDEMCSSKNGISCTFNEEYICGYQSNTKEVQWKYHRNGMSAINDDPITDSSGDVLGYYLFIDNRAILSGEVAIITSPYKEYSGPISIRFYVYISLSYTDILSRIRVYLLNDLGRRVLKLNDIAKSTGKTVFNPITNRIEPAGKCYPPRACVFPFIFQGQTYHTCTTVSFNGHWCSHDMVFVQGKWSRCYCDSELVWKQHESCVDVPFGNYSLQIEATVGESYSTTLAFDTVEVDTYIAQCTNIRKLDPPKISSPWNSCSFDAGDTCNFKQVSPYYWAKWRSIPNKFVNNVLHHQNTSTHSLVTTLHSSTCQTYMRKSNQLWTCMQSFYDTEGNLMSPDFPLDYRNLLSTHYSVYVAKYSKVTISSLYFNTEFDKDYLGLYKNAGTTISYVSGIRIPWKNITEASQIDLLFQTNAAITLPGFFLYYQIEKELDQDYVLGLSNRGQSIKQQTGGMYVDLDLSVVTSYLSAYCLSFRAMVGTHLIVTVETKFYSLDLAQIHYMPYWVDYSYTINPQASPYFVRLRGDLLYFGTAYTRYAIFLNNIKLKFNMCVDNKGLTTTSMTCNFEEGDCGYIDHSQIHSGSIWKLINTSTLFEANYFRHFNMYPVANMVMLASVALGKSVSANAILQSPEVNLQNASCLQFAVYCLHHPDGLFHIILYVDSIVHQTYTLKNILERCISDSWIDIYLDLPVGIVFLRFIVKDRQQWFDTQFDFYAIDNLHLNSGSCDRRDILDIHEPEEDNRTPVSDFPSKLAPVIWHSPTLPSLNRVKEYGPQLGSLDVMIKHIANWTVKKIDELTSHNINDMILKCSLNAYNCSGANFTPIFTQLGLCYTFNNKGLLHPVKQTGSGTGLQLMLNAEQYEQTIGLNNDGGFKVFLHDPEEISFIKYVGTAVPTGMRALLPIVTEQFEHLGGQFGNCSKKSNELYPNEPYSLYRCKESCRFRDFYEVCKCKDPSMPGVAKMCSLTQYVHCGFPYQCVNQTSTKKCPCLVACKSRSYSAHVSFGRLSKLNGPLYLVNKRDLVQKRFNRAVELRNRIYTDLLTDFIHPFAHFLNNYTKFLQSLNYHVMDPKTSTTDMIKYVSLMMQQKAINETVHGLFKDVPHLSRTYKSRVSSFLDSILGPPNDLIIALHKYQSIMLTNLTNTAEIQWAIKQEGKVIELAMQSHKVLQVFQKDNQPVFSGHVDHYIPMNYTLNNTCNEEGYFIDNITKIIKYIQGDITIMNNIHRNISTNFTKYINQVAILEHIWQNSSEFEALYIEQFKEKCILSYETFLQNLTEYIATIKPLEYISIRTQAVAEELLEVNEDYQHAYSVYRRYFSSNLTKYDVSKILSDATLSKWMQSVDRLYTAVDTNAFQVLNTYVTDVYRSLMTLYNNSLLYSLTLGGYWKNNYSYVERRAKQIHLWKKPMPNLQIQQLIMYELNHIGKSWPVNENLPQFVHHSLNFILQIRLEQFFGQLKTDMITLQRDLKNIIAAIKYTKEQIQADLAEFRQSIKIDGTFIKNNFVAVNLFFSELKYSVTQDIQAYDAASFFSDIGGYMGLLIGMSVITLVEVLDLLIYSNLVKCAAAVKHAKKVTRITVIPKV